MLSLLKKYLAVDVWFILQDSCFSPVVGQSEDAFRLFRIVLNEPNIYLGPRQLFMARFNDVDMCPTFASSFCQTVV